MENQIKTEKETLAKRAIFRANSGLHFIDECLFNFHKGGTDAAYSRSLYILFSYNFELMLKSRVLLASSLSSKKELLKEIKSHDLENLSKKISQSELKEIGIASIEKVNKSDFVTYAVKLTDGKEVILQDFTDVRYDFEKDSLRPVDQNESKRMKEEIDILLKATKKIMDMVNK